MPFITIDLFEGRDKETKRKLVQRLTEETCHILNCKPEAVHIRFNNVKREDWGTGGVLWSDK
ncbi:MAG: 4-oxalocrotonate tautomerase [Alcaligenaceae bacterium]|nr:4-oxalocrotonate tautomerase [Alcaligenaceae bacterium]